MNKVICVFRSGGDFIPAHVQALRRNLERCLTTPFEFHILSDIIVPDRFHHELKHNWPGWWSKLELFRPGLFNDDDRVIYMDLDTVLVGNVDWLFDFKGPFVTLRGFRRDRWASGLMAWQGQPPSLPYMEFKKEPIAVNGGDQRFLMDVLKGKTPHSYWQDQFPGRIVSYKRHVLLTEGNQPPENSVVCFHGKPRPWDAGEQWVQEARA